MEYYENYKLIIYLEKFILCCGNEGWNWVVKMFVGYCVVR